MQNAKVSIVIPVKNMGSVIGEAIESAVNQTYPNLEILVLDNCSTDNTQAVVKAWEVHNKKVKLIVNNVDIGAAKNLTKCYQVATGEYVVYLCADDLFAYDTLISEIVALFEANPKLGHISRWYYQFLNGIPGSVRVHRAENIYHCADNPSGLAFRRCAMNGEFSEKPFPSTAQMVKNVLDKGWEYYIIKKDTIAVRIQAGLNGSTTSICYHSSPTQDWLDVVGKQDFLIHPHFIGLIQLKNWGSMKLLISEIILYIKLRPANLLDPGFWLFGGISLFTPRCILREITKFYKHRISRNFFKERFKL